MSDRSNQPTSVDKTLEDLMDDSFTPDLNQLTATQQKEIADLHTQEQAPRLVDKLSEERQQQAKQLADQIDATDQQAVLTYGTKAQTKLSEFSQSMLSQVQTSDIGPIGDTLNDLMYRLQEANPDELRAGEGNIFQRMFGKVKQSIYEITAKYQKIGAQVDKVAVKLDKEKEVYLMTMRCLNNFIKKIRIILTL